MKPLKPIGVFLVGVLGSYLGPALVLLLFLVVGFGPPYRSMYLEIVLVAPLFLVVLGFPTICIMTWMTYRAGRLSVNAAKQYMLRNLCICTVLFLASVAVLVTAFKPDVRDFNALVVLASGYSGYLFCSLTISLSVRTWILAIQVRREKRKITDGGSDA